MTEAERQVVKKLLDDILAAGHAVGVWDGEANALPLVRQRKHAVG